VHGKRDSDQVEARSSDGQLKKAKAHAAAAAATASAAAASNSKVSTQLLEPPPPPVKNYDDALAPPSAPLQSSSLNAGAAGTVPRCGIAFPAQVRLHTQAVTVHLQHSFDVINGNSLDHPSARAPAADKSPPAIRQP
jgi:hypothetical protein